MAGSELLRVAGLRVGLPGAGEIVGGVDFAVERGRTLALVGPTGCGKTLVCRALLGQAPEGAEVSGRVEFLGRDALGLPGGAARLPAGDCMTMIWQDPAGCLDPARRVGDQVAETVRCRRGLDAAAARRAAVDLLAEVRLPDPGGYAGRFPHQLSGGQRQRVSLALALASDPALLLADEPTTALDRRIEAEILALLREARDRRGMGIVLVTHDLSLVPGNASDLAVIDRGEVVETGDAGRMLAAPSHAATRALLSAASDVPPPPRVEPGPEPALKVEDLRVRYPGSRGVRPFTAVDGVSLEIPAGETMGLAGESGCGKTSLARAVAGLVGTSGGGIRVAGMQPRPRRGRPAPAQMIFQDPASSLDPRMTVAETVEEAVLAAGGGRAGDLLAEVGLAGRGGAYPHQLSGGERQSVAVARALAARPRLLVADEPASSLDALSRAGILKLLDRLRRERGLPLLLISHDLGLLRRYCHRVAVMDAGKLLEILPAGKSPTHPHTLAMTAAEPSLPASRGPGTH